MLGNLSTFLQQEFNNQRNQWENLLKAELKLTELGNKGTKKSLELGVWPTLSLEQDSGQALPVAESWKKAAQTYTHPATVQLPEDLGAGVRVFFIHKNHFSSHEIDALKLTLSHHPDAKDLKIFFLGDDDSIISGKFSHDGGGTIIQELAEIAIKLTKIQPSSELHLGLYLGTHFFKNIAKIRAAKLLAAKIFTERDIKTEVRFIGLTSLRDWTLFERYSNMLRNNISVASGFIAGCDYVQSSGYQSLLELEAHDFNPEHVERSLRMARNTSHILALESMLGVTHDASYGSFHLETLTQHFAQQSWELMQKVLIQGDEYLKKEVDAVAMNRSLELRTRKKVMAGINDFPDRSESLRGIKLNPSLYRNAKEFEELRLRVERLKLKPTLHIALFGNYAALNARLNFCKNYFEVLGLEVSDTGVSETDEKNFVQKLSQASQDILVICAADEDYPKLASAIEGVKNLKYIAGKVNLGSLLPLYAGQNIYEVLQSLVIEWETK
jgi:hypothetical protein